LKAQTTWTVPGDYLTLALAISNLNAVGVPIGGLTIDVAAGHTETSVNITLSTTTASAANTIVIQKSGVGANPIIQSNAAGSGVINPPASGNGDCFFEIFSTDYVTIDGIDLLENYTGVSTTLMVEYGYFLTKVANDACNYINIRNCNISISKNSTYTKGIFQSNIHGSTGNSVNVNNAGGQCVNNEYDLNTIHNVYNGIYLAGFNSTTYPDLNCSIGIFGGNTISDFGGSSFTTPIYTIYQKHIIIGNNIVDGGLGNASTHYGIMVQNPNNSDVIVYNNTVTLLSTGYIKGIYVTGGSLTGGFTNNVNIFGNLITGCNNGLNSSEFGGLIIESVGTTTNIYQNEISDNASGQLLYAIGLSGYPTNLTIHDNLITDCQAIDDFFGVSRAYYSTLALAGNINFYNNVISNITIANDLFEACLFTGFFGTSGDQNFYNNRIYGIYGTSTYSGAQLIGITLSTGVSVNVYNNMISDFTVSPGSSVQSIKLLNCPNNYTLATNYITHNTLYLNASGSATNFTSTALYLNALDVTLSNNIICNTSNHLGTGKTNAIEKHTSMAIGEILNTSNNNSIYAGAPGAGNNIFYDGATGYTTLAAYQALVTPGENNSITLNPFPFFTSASDVHISLCAGCPLADAGQPEPPVTNDYDYEARNAFTPEIGADEIVEALPVILISFTANSFEKEVILNWKTESELNNARFEVLRSNDGVHFKIIGEVAGSGTSSEFHEYEFIDLSPFNGRSYYQLKQIDFNGNFEFSKTVSVHRNHSGEMDILVSPNPFSDYLNINISTSEEAHIVLSIQSLEGIQLFKDQFLIPVEGKSLRLNTQNLPAGIYSVSAFDGREYKTFKVVKH
jgi:hypothetical protein